MSVAFSLASLLCFSSYACNWGKSNRAWKVTMKVKLDVMHVTNFEFTVVERTVGTSLLTLGLVVMEWICIFLFVCRGSGGSHWSRYGILTSVALVDVGLPVCSDICFVLDVFLVHNLCSFFFPLGQVVLCCFFTAIITVMWPYNSGPELAWFDFCCFFIILFLFYLHRLFCWITSRGQSKPILL